MNENEFTQEKIRTDINSLDEDIRGLLKGAPEKIVSTIVAGVTTAGGVIATGNPTIALLYPFAEKLSSLFLPDYTTEIIADRLKLLHKAIQDHYRTVGSITESLKKIELSLEDRIQESGKERVLLFTEDCGRLLRDSTGATKEDLAKIVAKILSSKQEFGDNERLLISLRSLNDFDQRILLYLAKNRKKFWDAMYWTGKDIGATFTNQGEAKWRKKDPLLVNLVKELKKFSISDSIEAYPVFQRFQAAGFLLLEERQQPQELESDIEIESPSKEELILNSVIIDTKLFKALSDLNK